MTDSPSAESRARPAEIIFEVTEAVEGGYDAGAPGYRICTQGESWDDLKEMARDAVLCHLDDGGASRVARLLMVQHDAIPAQAQSEGNIEDPTRSVVFHR